MSLILSPLRLNKIRHKSFILPPCLESTMFLWDILKYIFFFFCQQHLQFTELFVTLSYLR